MPSCVVACLILLAPLITDGQQLPQHPEPTRIALNNIVGNARLLATANDDLRYPAVAILRSATWLSNRPSFGEPAEYRLQLTIDDYLLAYARQHPSEAAGIVDAVAQDLDIKKTDCDEHGHGRLVPVEIHTVKSGSDNGGWQVFYQWVPPAKGFEPAEMLFPQPSSPTTAELPPGFYRMRAEKTDGKGGSVKSETVNVPVGGAKSILWKIPVP
ncbi:MAG TPA: hypothetical protein VI455_16460 [Terriglobia bacterium]